jgi:DNA-binding ferritin-like protein
MASQKDNAATFVAVLFHSGTNAHFMHLQTNSYARHKALNKYYENIIDLADKWAESYQGTYEVIDKYPSDFHLARDPVAYIEKIKQFVDTIRKVLPTDTPLQNIVDEICELIDSTLYKLKTFK